MTKKSTARVNCCSMVILQFPGDNVHFGLIFAFKRCTDRSFFVEKLVSVACRSPIVHVDIIPYCGLIDPSAHGFYPSRCIAFGAFMFKRFSMRTPCYTPDEWSCFYLPLDSDAYMASCEWLTAALDTRYDYVSLPLCLTPLRRLPLYRFHSDNPSSLFCSEACVILLNHIHRTPKCLERAIPSSVSPAHLYRIMRQIPCFREATPLQ